MRLTLAPKGLTSSKIWQWSVNQANLYVYIYIYIYIITSYIINYVNIQTGFSVASFSVNPFYLSIVFHIETSYLIRCTNQMTGSFMERNTRVKWFNWNTFYTYYLLFCCKVLTSIQQLLEKVRTGTLLFTPRMQIGYWTYLRCPEDILDIFSASFLRLFCGLCPGGSYLIEKMKEVTYLFIDFWKLNGVIVLQFKKYYLWWPVLSYFYLCWSAILQLQQSSLMVRVGY